MLACLTITFYLLPKMLGVQPPLFPSTKLFLSTQAFLISWHLLSHLAISINSPTSVLITSLGEMEGRPAPMQWAVSLWVPQDNILCHSQFQPIFAVYYVCGRVYLQLDNGYAK